MIVGVTGFFCAGKDSFAEQLVERGFEHVSLSDIIREEIRSRGEEITILRLTATGNALRAAEGPGVLARRALSRLPSDRDAVVTSIRHPAEVETLREREDFFMVFVDAPQRVRYERSRGRARPGDPETFEAFCRAEREQMESADMHAQQLAACRDMADSVIDNGGSYGEFLAAIDRTLEAFRRRAASGD